MDEDSALAGQAGGEEPSRATEREEHEHVWVARFELHGAPPMTRWSCECGAWQTT